MILLAHPLGSRFVREALRALEENGLLAGFHTAVAWRTGSLADRILPERLLRQIRRRSFPEVSTDRIHTRPLRELGRLLLPGLGIHGPVRHEEGSCSTDAVFRDLDRAVARAVSGSAGKGLTGVYAYEDGALDTFRAARARGLRTLYDLPIGYHRAAQRLFAEEAELSPDFAPMLDGLRDSGAKLERKAEEARLADRIIVPSEFVRQTLEQEGFPASRIRLVPFGAPDAVRARTWTDEDLRRPLRLLFAGSVGQRKGIGYLLQAMRLLKGAPVELAVLGTVVGDSAPLAPYRDLFRHEPTRPHAEVLELMRSCDVLVLPSLWEGLAQVQLEALACGLPLLVTPNAGGAHLVRDGINGFLVPIRSPEALAEKIRWFVANREALPAMSAAAAAAARQSTWSAYREGIVRAATEPLGETFR